MPATLFGDVQVSGAVFYSDIQDSIQNVFFAANGNSSIVGINADGEYYGLELSADWDVTRTLRVGGNYTYIERDLDYRGSRARDHSLRHGTRNDQPQWLGRRLPDRRARRRTRRSSTLSWQATNQLTLTPSLELSSDRTVLITSCRRR